MVHDKKLFSTHMAYLYQFDKGYYSEDDSDYVYESETDEDDDSQYNSDTDSESESESDSSVVIEESIVPFDVPTHIRLTRSKVTGKTCFSVIRPIRQRKPPVRYQA